MSKQVQLVGHTAEESASFVGADRELTIDVDNWEIRIHDGVTPGGRRVLNRDSNDSRYQEGSAELDGFLGWEPSEKGILTRLGPGDFRLRGVEVNQDNLTIVNPLGYLGNFQFSLKPEVSSSHTWSATQTFTGEVVASGGVTGNVTGNLTGDSTGTHTGNVVGNVTGNLAGNTTGTHTGSVDTSGGGLLLADGQILGAWLEDAIYDYIIGKGVPIGTCVPYFGDVGDIPPNWKLCDGTAGTPDLRGRMVMGASAGHLPGDIGGAETHSHTATVNSAGAHTHTGTVGNTVLSVDQLPVHNHYNGVTDQSTNAIFPYGYGASPATLQHVENSGSDGAFVGLTSPTGSGNPHNHSLTVNSDGAHTHTASTGSSNGLPPYYAMHWIMKAS